MTGYVRETVRSLSRTLVARAIVQAALRSPRLWSMLRPRTRRTFDQMASRWDGMVARQEAAWYTALDAALDTLPAGWRPARILDVGAGTGRGTYHLAARFPEAVTVGVDLSPAMLQSGLRRQRSEALPPVRFVAGDGAALPLARGTADLVVLLNAPPFFDEIARVLRPGGVVVLAYSHGPRQPIYLDGAAARRHLARHGFVDAHAGQAEPGTFVIARREAPPRK